MNKKEALGFSVYESTFQTQKPLLLENAHSNAFIFISLHIVEEFNANYCQKIEQICQFLSNLEYRIIADVSPNTVRQFGEKDLTQLAKRLKLYALRLDFGFSEEEILYMAKQMPIVLNASTVTPDICQRAVALGNPVMAMHNFYPRRETGLDTEYYLKTTKALQRLGVLVLAFIPGNEQLRGPLFERLPTLEKHRLVPPSVAYIELVEELGADIVFVGDPGISKYEQQRIMHYQDKNIIELPVYLNDAYKKIYNQIFTSRIDSPKTLVRVQESRTMPLFEKDLIMTDGGYQRTQGTITIDNHQYGRYAGEIQIIRTDLPADVRVNCIGKVLDDFIQLANYINGGQKFLFSHN